MSRDSTRSCKEIIYSVLSRRKTPATVEQVANNSRLSTYKFQTVRRHLYGMAADGIIRQHEVPVKGSNRTIAGYTL